MRRKDILSSTVDKKKCKLGCYENTLWAISSRFPSHLHPCLSFHLNISVLFCIPKKMHAQKGENMFNCLMINRCNTQICCTSQQNRVGVQPNLQNKLPKRVLNRCLFFLLGPGCCSVQPCVRSEYVCVLTTHPDQV